MTTPESDPIDLAISALTAAAKQTRVRGEGTPSEQVEPVDFGEIACFVITTVAANRGGVEELLAGRPGSWEADYVRRIVLSTAGEDVSDLLRYRTEPVRLSLDVEGVFSDFGLDALYEEADEELARASEAADDALFEALATDEERVRLAEIQAEVTEHGNAHEHIERDTALMFEAIEIGKALVDRAIATGHPLAATIVAARRDTEALEALWEQDQAAYATSYREAVQRELTEHGTAAPLDISTTDYVEPEGSWDWVDFIDRLKANAQQTAPLPATGAAPDFSDGTPADALRRAGQTYLDRVRAAS